jgi:hypothetical protein
MSHHSDYTPSKDYMINTRDYSAAEKKRLEKWRKELKSMSTYNSNNTNVYGGGGFGAATGYVSGYTLTNSTITTNTTNLADSAITINGGPNGSMKVDVPLVVNGRDVMKEIDEMRDALLLLKRDVDMEAKYPKLKELKDEYERALEKYKTFEAIKESK